MVPLAGSLEATRDLFQPYLLLDAAGVPVPVGGAYFAELVPRQRTFAPD